MRSGQLHPPGTHTKLGLVPVQWPRVHSAPWSPFGS